MSNYNIYKDIASRTNGDIYVGVVGPVRTGKSTFINRFMECLVLDKVGEGYPRERARDELPQSADGRTIMTTEPKFVPSEAIPISIDNADARIRMIDCVGYLIDGALGGDEEGAPRMVKTPWSDQDLPFERAAEIGTDKVVREHSTVGVVVTTDGTIGDISRGSYVEAEERVIKELKAIGKPFTVVLNTATPNSPDTIKLAESLEERYGVGVTALNVLTAGAELLEQILYKVLMDFPLKRIDVNLPKWMRALGKDCPFINWLKDRLIGGDGIVKLKDFLKITSNYEENDYFEQDPDAEVDSGKGVINLSFRPKEGLFYRLLSETCSECIEDEFTLMSYLVKAADAYRKYQKLKEAMDSVQETGYGVVLPTMEEMELKEPELLKRGTQFGVKLKA
ncbi:MAG: stage IV sporulation protein A, partial [Clostridia bacterium]|nr:stage IV sporulation protein A [Clostridia bacterium]